MEFYACQSCHNVAIKLIDDHHPLSCCGNEMELLPHNDDVQTQSLHRPNIRKTGNFVTITIGKDHPMLDVHHISFVIVETTTGFLYKNVENQKEAKASFILANDEEILKIYSYCTVHMVCEHRQIK